MQPDEPRIAQTREKIYFWTTNHDPVGYRIFPHQSSLQYEKHQLASPKHLGNMSYYQVALGSVGIIQVVPIHYTSFSSMVHRPLLTITPEFLTSIPSDSESYIILRLSILNFLQLEFEV